MLPQLSEDLAQSKYVRGRLQAPVHLESAVQLAQCSQQIVGGGSPLPIGSALSRLKLARIVLAGTRVRSALFYLYRNGMASAEVGA